MKTGTSAIYALMTPEMGGREGVWGGGKITLQG